MEKFTPLSSYITKEKEKEEEKKIGSDVVTGVNYGVDFIFQLV